MLLFFAPRYGSVGVVYSTVSLASVFVVFIRSFAAFFLWFQLPFCSGGRAEREGTNCVRGVNGKSMSQFVRKQHLEGAFVQTLANDFGNRSATFAGVDQAIKGCICLFSYGLVIELFRASVGELKKTLKKRRCINYCGWFVCRNGASTCFC